MEFLPDTSLGSRETNMWNSVVGKFCTVQYKNSVLPSSVLHCCSPQALSKLLQSNYLHSSQKGNWTCTQNTQKNCLQHTRRMWHPQRRPAHDKLVAFKRLRYGADLNKFQNLVSASKKTQLMLVLILSLSRFTYPIYISQNFASAHYRTRSNKLSPSYAVGFVILDNIFC
jgi:hypothetical protein